jgi:hypothetical protein
MPVDADREIQKRNQMIGMRMRIPDGALMPFEFIKTHDTGEKVMVFLVTKGQAVTLEDNSDLFPSDKLITQLRLLAG